MIINLSKTIIKDLSRRDKKKDTEDVVVTLMALSIKM